MDHDILSLIKAAREQFQEIGLSESTIETYQQRSFNQIIRRYTEGGDFQYEQAIMDELISDAEAQFRGGSISRKSRDWRIRGILILQEIQETGAFQWKMFKENCHNEVPEVFNDTTAAFFDSLDTCDRHNKEITNIVVRFCAFLDSRSIDSYNKASPNDLRDFLAEMHETRPKSMDAVVASLKKLFSFLSESEEVAEASWMLISSPRSRDYSVKPAIAKADLIAVMNQIDCSRSPGKRDFAVLSLAMTTGLRAGDIASIKLSDISWKSSEIHLSQGKTGKRITLPLQASVRDAVADYILNERPRSNSGTVFLRALPPYQPLCNGVSVAHIFRRCLEKAGITHEINDGKTFHGIRRFLGSAMVAEGTPIATVSQVLGHQTIRPTRQYIAIDLDGLRKCALSMDSLGGGV